VRICDFLYVLLWIALPSFIRICVRKIYAQKLAYERSWIARLVRRTNMLRYTVFYPCTFWGKVSTQTSKLPPWIFGHVCREAEDNGFLKFQFLTVGTVNRVELHHRAKFRQNRACRGRNITIFRFLKMAAAAILDFQNFKFLTAGTVKGAKGTSVPNFVKIDRTAAEILRFFDFSRLRPSPCWIFEISNF